jgi:hypothetical protein
LWSLHLVGSFRQLGLLAGPNEVAMGGDAGKSLLAVFLIGEAHLSLESRSISTYKSARFLKIKSLIMCKTIESISSTFQKLLFMEDASWDWSLAERRVAERRLVVSVEALCGHKSGSVPAERDLDEVSVLWSSFRQRAPVACRACGLCAAGGQVRVVRCAG